MIEKSLELIRLCQIFLGRTFVAIEPLVTPGSDIVMEVLISTDNLVHSKVNENFNCTAISIVQQPTHGMLKYSTSSRTKLIDQSDCKPIHGLAWEI